MKLLKSAAKRRSIHALPAQGDQKVTTATAAYQPPGFRHPARPISMPYSTAERGMAIER